MKVDKRNFDAVLGKLLKAKPETAATIAKPERKPKTAPSPKSSR